MADIPKDIEDLKTVTRSAHEAIRDLRLAVKEAGTVLDRMAEVREDLMKVAEAVFEEQMQDQVKAGLDHYVKSQKEHIDLSTQAVFARFDTLARVMLGKESEDDRRVVMNGAMDTQDMIRHIAQMRDDGLIPEGHPAAFGTPDDLPQGLKDLLQ